jgi:hypothetical protein
VNVEYNPSYQSNNSNGMKDSFSASSSMSLLTSSKLHYNHYSADVHDITREDRTGYDSTQHDMTAQHRTGQHTQHRTGQDRRHNNTAHNMTVQDRIGEYMTQHSTGNDRRAHNTTTHHRT